MGGGFRTLGARGASERERFVSECDGLKTSRDASDKEPQRIFTADGQVTGLERHVFSSCNRSAAPSRPRERVRLLDDVP